MKYIVMECQFSYAVVLDESGRFLKVANMHYEVGQTVTDVVEMRKMQSKPQAKKKSSRRWIYSLAAMAACLTLVITSIFTVGQTAYASVYMTINPEVRIDVNRRDTVVGLEGMNEDGKQLIEGYSYKKKELNLVMDELVDSSIDMGYLHSGGQITIALDAKDSEWVTEKGNDLSNHLNQYLAEKISVTVEITDMNANESGTVVPVGSENDSYGEDDYGTVPSQTGSGQQEQPVVNYGDSRYQQTIIIGDDGQSDYETPGSSSGTSEDEGNSNYGTPSDDGGNSNYEAPASGSTGNSQTSSGDDGDSNYSSSDDSSDYGDSDDDD